MFQFYDHFSCRFTWLMVFQPQHLKVLRFGNTFSAQLPKNATSVSVSDTFSKDTTASAFSHLHINNLVTSLPSSFVF